MKIPPELDWQVKIVGDEPDNDFEYMNARVERYDDRLSLCLWESDEYVRLGIPIDRIPEFAAYLNQVYQYWRFMRPDGSPMAPLEVEQEMLRPKTVREAILKDWERHEPGLEYLKDK